MKIQLSSTLPFSPIQLDSRQLSPRRAVGQLQGSDGRREFRHPVYEFRHGDDDQIYYQIDPQERAYLDEAPLQDTADAHALDCASGGALEWVQHDDSLSYKPYAFLVMNAMTQLVADWDGVIYQAPSGERLRDSVWNATLQVVDACVCHKLGLWVKVNLMAEKGVANGSETAVSRQLGWVPLQKVVAQ